MGRALQDHTSTVYLKGNKMAHIGPDASTIIDLDAGTLTTIDNQHRSYTTMTFDEMNQRMKEAQEKMSRHGGNGGADIHFDVKVDDTGKTKTIDGKTAKEYVMTMTAQGQEQGQPVPACAFVQICGPWHPIPDRMNFGISIRRWRPR